MALDRWARCAKNYLRWGAAGALLFLATSALAYDNPMDPNTTSGTFLGKDGQEIGFCRMGNILSDAPNYDWWYGCTPTSAGMMMAYYARNGYQGIPYPNFVPGGTPGTTSFGGGGGLDYDGDVTPDLACNQAIASAGHINDFYVSGYQGTGDDRPAPWHSFDCLADFMGTSQDACGNSNGGTTMFFNIDGTPWTEADAIAQGVEDMDGTYGIGEYVRCCGYEVETLYTQVIHLGPYFPNGFDLQQYKDEIDAGRPVLVHIAGHSMYGLGYDSVISDRIYVRDTWDDDDGGGPHTDGTNPGYLAWGGEYPPGGTMGHLFCTVFEPIPEPLTLVLCVAGMTLLASRRR